MKILNLIRLPKIDKEYYRNQMQLFADRFDSKQIIEVQFGKQDIRGTESITIFDNRHCVPKQLNFNNKWEMLGYIKGVNDANDKYNYFSNYIN